MVFKCELLYKVNYKGLPQVNKNFSLARYMLACNSLDPVSFHQIDCFQVFNGLTDVCCYLFDLLLFDIQFLLDPCKTQKLYTKIHQYWQLEGYMKKSNKRCRCFFLSLHPRKLTWRPKMMVLNFKQVTPFEHGPLLVSM